MSHAKRLWQDGRTRTYLVRRPILSLGATSISAGKSFSMVSDRERSPAVGCTGYIEKPKNPDTFVAEVLAYVQSKPEGIQP